jgi:hypothetical protein
VDTRSVSVVRLQRACSDTGQPGDQDVPFRSITPTPDPDEPPVITPLLLPVNCRSAHVPLASDKSSPPSGLVEKHDDARAPTARVIRVPALTRGHTSTDGDVEPSCDELYGDRSHRSNGSTAPTEADGSDTGSVTRRSTTNVLEEPDTTYVVSDRRPDEKLTLLRTNAVLSWPP